MKFFEQMDPVEREVMIRKAVAFNLSLEGMNDAAQAILQETVQENSKKIPATDEPVTDRTSK